MNFPLPLTANRHRGECHSGHGDDEVAADLGGDRRGRRRLLFGARYHQAVVPGGLHAVAPVATAVL